MPPRELVLEARRRKSDPLFGLLPRAAAAALAHGDIELFAGAAERARARDDEVLFMAREQGVTGLLARLSARRPGSLPAPVHEALEADAGRIAARAGRLAEDVTGLGERARRAGLPFAPLKGAVLAPLRWKDPTLRPAADVDLLAVDGTLEAWRALLVEAGYRETGRTFKHLSFVRGEERVPDGFEERADNPRPVDLHAVLHEPFLGRVLDVTEAYRATLSEGELHGAPALLPDDDGLLLHLLLHAAPHAVGRGARLLQLADFGVLVPSPRAAHRVGESLGEVAWGTAHLAERALPGCLPKRFLEGLAFTAPPDARRARWLSRPGLDTGEEERTILALAELPLCATPGDAWRRLRAVLPERTVLEERYGPRWYPVALALYARDRLLGG